LRAVLLPLLFFSKGVFLWGMVVFSSVDEPTRVDFGTVFRAGLLHLEARPSGLASPSLPTGEGEAKQALPGTLARPTLPPTFAGETNLLK